MGNVVTKRWTLWLMACRLYRPPLCIYIMNESLYIVHKIRGGILFLLLAPRANNNNLLVNPNFGVYDATKLRDCLCTISWDMHSQIKPTRDLVF